VKGIEMRRSEERKVKEVQEEDKVPVMISKLEIVLEIVLEIPVEI
jgi:hypothetical protein